MPAQNGELIRNFRETYTALKIWPDVRQWQSVFLVTVPALLIIAGTGFLAGWLSWKPVTGWRSIAMIALALFFVPALLEELFFRGVLLSWLAVRWSRWAAWISTILFVLWHPLQVLFVGPPRSELFLAPSFLFVVLILGMVLSHIRIVSKSLWPPILVHWIAVVIWKSLLGGPF